MNDPLFDHDLDALFALARRNRPDTSRAEYAFETRLLTNLRRQRESAISSILAQVSWRMIPFFAVFVIALGIWRADAGSATDEAILSSATHPDLADLLNTFN